MSARFRVVADESWHRLPIGAVVTPTDPPEWADDDDEVGWFTLGGDGDEVCICPTDLVRVRHPLVQAMIDAVVGAFLLTLVIGVGMAVLVNRPIQLEIVKPAPSQDSTPHRSTGDPGDPDLP